jgi:hypothetical protein
MADRPPGREREGGPHPSTSRPATPSPSRAEVIHSRRITRESDGGQQRAELAAEHGDYLDLIAAAWRHGYHAALSDAVVASLLRIFPPPGHVGEIEKRRYPPDGREHFGKPRPGDYGGRQT